MQVVERVLDEENVPDKHCSHPEAWNSECQRVPAAHIHVLSLDVVMPIGHNEQKLAPIAGSVYSLLSQVKHEVAPLFEYFPAVHS